MRKSVYDKFNGRCAYCGKEITIKEMQIDHIVPKRLFLTSKEADTYENLFPSCSRCNHYKRGGTPEYLREMLLNMREKILGTYLGKVAVDYNMIKWVGWDGKFYFERIESYEEDNHVRTD